MLRYSIRILFVRRFEIGGEAARGREFDARFVIASRASKRERELKVRLGVVGREADGFSELIDGRGGILTLHRVQAGVYREYGGLRIGFQLVQALGFGKRARRALRVVPRL